MSIVKSKFAKAAMSDSEMMRDLAAEDRPREKAMTQGIASLTASELLAILLRTGVHGKNVVQLSREILAGVDNDLARLARMTPGDLAQIQGLGPAKAITLVAAVELGLRCRGALQSINQWPLIRNAEDVDMLMRPQLERIRHEEFWVLALNRAGRVEARLLISSGGFHATVVDTKVLFKKALDARASSLILVHNHPGGNLTPSAQDDALTRRIAEGGKILDIQVLDHVIISPVGFFSYRDEGRL